MAEAIGLIASVVQVAGAGLKLSQTLYQYADGVATADRRIKDIAKEIQLTSFVIEQLGDVFKHDETSTLMSQNAVKTANETMKECSSVFAEIDATLKKSKKNTLGRLMLPFRDNKIELLRNHIDKLKSTLLLLMQVLTHAHQVATKKLDREAETKQKAQIQELIELKKKSTKKYEESARNISLSDGSTIIDPDEAASDKEYAEEESAHDITMVAASIGSTITSKTLATCVQHVRSLLEDIETLQQALTTRVEGDDHSEHHQSLIGSYFRARGHLDSLLFSGAEVQNKESNPVKGSLSTTCVRSIDVQVDVQRVTKSSTGNDVLSKQVSLADRESLNVAQDIDHKTKTRGADLDAEIGGFHAYGKALRHEAQKEEDAKEVRKSPIKFQDTLGRLYSLPFHTCMTRERMQQRIERIYNGEDLWKYKVTTRHFDILDGDGYVILDEDWEDTIEPGMSLTMRFWTRNLHADSPDSAPQSVTETANANKSAYSTQSPDKYTTRRSDADSLYERPAQARQRNQNAQQEHVHGQHAPAVSAAAKRQVKNAAPFELGLEGAALANRRGKKQKSNSSLSASTTPVTDEKQTGTPLQRRYDPRPEQESPDPSRRATLAPTPGLRPGIQATRGHYSSVDSNRAYPGASRGLGSYRSLDRYNARDGYQDLGYAVPQREDAKQTRFEHDRARSKSREKEDTRIPAREMQQVESVERNRNEARESQRQQEAAADKSDLRQQQLAILKKATSVGEKPADAQDGREREDMEEEFSESGSPRPHPDFLSETMRPEKRAATLQDLATENVTQHSGQIGTERPKNVPGSHLMSPIVRLEHYSSEGSPSGSEDGRPKSKSSHGNRFSANHLSPYRQDASSSEDEGPQVFHNSIPTSEGGYGYGINDEGSDVTTNPSIIQGPMGGSWDHDQNGNLRGRLEECAPTPIICDEGIASEITERGRPLAPATTSAPGTHSLSDSTLVELSRQIQGKYSDVRQDFFDFSQLPPPTLTNPKREGSAASPNQEHERFKQQTGLPLESIAGLKSTTAADPIVLEQEQRSNPSEETEHDPYKVPPKLPQQDRLDHTRTDVLQAEIDATVAIMHENINKVSERGERLDSLQERTEDLAASAAAFRRAADTQSYWSWGKSLALLTALPSPTPLPEMRETNKLLESGPARPSKAITGVQSDATDIPVLEHAAVASPLNSSDELPVSQGGSSQGEDARPNAPIRLAADSELINLVSSKMPKRRDIGITPQVKDDDEQTSSEVTTGTNVTPVENADPVGMSYPPHKIPDTISSHHPVRRLDRPPFYRFTPPSASGIGKARLENNKSPISDVRSRSGQACLSQATGVASSVPGAQIPSLPTRDVRDQDRPHHSTGSGSMTQASESRSNDNKRAGAPSERYKEYPLPPALNNAYPERPSSVTKEMKRAADRDEIRRRRKEHERKELERDIGRKENPKLRRKERLSPVISNSSSKRPRSSRRRSVTMSPAEAEEQRQNLSAELSQMQCESRAVGASDQEERLAWETFYYDFRDNEWGNLADLDGYRRDPSETYSDVSSVHASPYLIQHDKSEENRPSPVLNFQADPQLFHNPVTHKRPSFSPSNRVSKANVFEQIVLDAAEELSSSPTIIYDSAVPPKGRHSTRHTFAYEAKGKHRNGHEGQPDSLLTGQKKSRTLGGDPEEDIEFSPVPWKDEGYMASAPGEGEDDSPRPLSPHISLDMLFDRRLTSVRAIRQMQGKYAGVPDAALDPASTAVDRNVIRKPADIVKARRERQEARERTSRSTGSREPQSAGVRGHTHGSKSTHESGSSERARLGIFQPFKASSIPSISAPEQPQSYTVPVADRRSGTRTPQMIMHERREGEEAASSSTGNEVFSQGRPRSRYESSFRRRIPVKPLPLPSSVPKEAPESPCVPVTQAESDPLDQMTVNGLVGVDTSGKSSFDAQEDGNGDVDEVEALLKDWTTVF